MLRPSNTGYLYGKRDLIVWQKRPIYVAKETYLCGKRDLLLMVHVRLFSGVDIIHMWQKRPIYVAKETYLCGKRLLMVHVLLSSVQRRRHHTWHSNPRYQAVHP